MQDDPQITTGQIVTWWCCCAIIGFLAGSVLAVAGSYAIAKAAGVEWPFSDVFQ